MFWVGLGGGTGGGRPEWSDRAASDAFAVQPSPLVRASARLVVDFVTYRFGAGSMPSFASGPALPATATLWVLFIVLSSFAVFRDRRVKAADNHFGGFPRCGNSAASTVPAAFVAGALYLASPSGSWLTCLFHSHVIHPVRVVAPAVALTCRCSRSWRARLSSCW